MLFRSANISNGFNLGLDLVPTGVTAGAYGSATAIPTVNTDKYGRITSITTSPVSTTIGLTADSGTGSVSGGGTLNITGTANQLVTSVSGNNVNLSFVPNIAFNTFTTGNLTVTSNLNFAGGGVRTTTSATPPANPVPGDMWYQSGTDLMYRYVYDGTNSYWLDMFSTPLLAILPSRYMAGSSGEVQFNDDGQFGANAMFTFDKTVGVMSVPRGKIGRAHV